MRKARLIIAILAVWIIISNGLFIFFWKVTNLGDWVMFQRVEPLVCKLEEYKYRTPYSKIEKANISEEDWATYQRVGTELMQGTQCRKYTDIVWFNLIEKNLDSTFEDSIKE